MLIFLPQIVKQLGLTNMQVGWVTMIPYICGAISMLTWGAISDRMGAGGICVWRASSPPSASSSLG
jgi:MFS family permease